MTVHENRADAPHFANETRYAITFGDGNTGQLRPVQGELFAQARRATRPRHDIEREADLVAALSEPHHVVFERSTFVEFAKYPH